MQPGRDGDQVPLPRPDAWNGSPAILYGDKQINWGELVAMEQARFDRSLVGVLMCTIRRDRCDNFSDQ